MIGARAPPGRLSANKNLRRALGGPSSSPSATSRRSIIFKTLPRLVERSSENCESCLYTQPFASHSPSQSSHLATSQLDTQPQMAYTNNLNKENHPTSSSNSYASAPARKISNTDEVTDMLRDSLRIKEAANNMLTRVRSSSSSYHSQTSEPRHKSQSPPPTDRRNILRISDLSKYSRENDRLSNLHSSTETAEDSGTAVYDAAQDAAEAVRVWERECEPHRRISWNRYELPDSPEVLPSDSASIRKRSPTTLNTAREDGNDLLPKPGVGRSLRSNHNNIAAMKDQYDGPKDHRELDSPHPAATPCPAMYHGDAQNSSRKRKASVFSLRSLASNLPKRPKLGFKKKAAGLFQRIISRGKKEKKTFQNWRASQHKLKPANALKKEHGDSYGASKMAEKKHGDEEWWAEGVEKYRAPGWMEFQRSPTRKQKSRA